jgi:xylulokinase
MPRIAGAAERAGTLTPAGASLTGLPAGIPVAVGTGDDFAGSLGAGLLEPGSAVCIAGTAEVVGALCGSPVIDPAGLVETHGYPAGGYFVENPGWLSGGALEWVASVMGLPGAAEAAQLAEAAPAGSDGLLFLPALSGAMSPEWVPGARGCFYGLSPSHGRSHLARAVVEGCAFAARDVIERIRRLSVPVGRMLLTGGGARSRLLARVRADASRLPVRRLLDGDTTPLGAAMCAAVAAGICPDLRACAAGVGSAGEDFPPDAGAADFYDEAHRRYRRLFDSLRPVFGQREGA